MIATGVAPPVDGPSPRLDGATDRRRHVPGLDGLRAVAVIAVLLFHHGTGWAGGGFLGVSLFFVLSGFLIGAMLGREVDRTGTVDLRAFAGRRLRRLVPAMVAMTLFVVVAGRILAPDGPTPVRSEVLGSLGFVENWRLLTTAQSYGSLFAAPSPLLHTWSLGIEAQFYLLVAPFVALAFRRQRLGPLVALLLAGAAAHLVLGFAGADDAVYYSLPTRLPELLVGVLLARRFAPGALGGPGVSGAGRRWVGPAGVVGLVALAVAVVVVDFADAVVHRGLLLAAAVVGGAVVVAASTEGTALDRALSVRPLVAVGRISYGIYLVHLPLFLILTPTRIGLDGAALFAVRVAATLALAGLSWRTIEQPWLRDRRRHRHARGDRRGVVAVGGPMVVAASVVAILAVPASVDDDLEATVADVEQAATVPVPPGVATVAVFGDSTALGSALALSEWGRATDRLGLVNSVVELGCGLVHEGEFAFRGVPGPFPPKCDWPVRWADAVDVDGLDIAIVQTGPIDVRDHRLPGDDAWRGPGDRVYDEALLAEMVAAVDLLSSRGATVVWLTSPTIDREGVLAPVGSGDDVGAEPGRMARYNELVLEAAARRPALVVVDLAAWVASLPDDARQRVRPDGVHFAEDAAGEVSAWLGPAVLDAVADVMAEGAPVTPGG
ncbi:MAG: acyltransferase family protein [Acidimicrobiales bacterium]